jgi:protein-disulfide isomerase
MDKKAGEEAGVNGTPAFFVNGHLISGAQPFESFKTAIDAELAQK